MQHWQEELGEWQMQHIRRSAETGHGGWPPTIDQRADKMVLMLTARDAHIAELEKHLADLGTMLDKEVGDGIEREAQRTVR